MCKVSCGTSARLGRELLTPFWVGAALITLQVSWRVYESYREKVFSFSTGYLDAKEWSLNLSSPLPQPFDWVPVRSKASFLCKS